MRATMIINSHSVSLHSYLYDSLAKVMMSKIESFIYLFNFNRILLDICGLKIWYFDRPNLSKNRFHPGWFGVFCVKLVDFFFWTWTVEVAFLCTRVAFVHSSQVCIEARTGLPSTGSLCVSNEQTGNCVNTHFLWRWQSCPEFHIWDAWYCIYISTRQWWTKRSLDANFLILEVLSWRPIGHISNWAA